MVVCYPHFTHIVSVLKRFLDVDHLISLIVAVPKRDTQKTAESTIINVSLLIFSFVPRLCAQLERRERRSW